MKKLLVRITCLVIVAACTLQPQSALAQASGLLDFNQNDINQYRPPGSGLQFCDDKGSGGGSAPIANFKPDPNAVAMLKTVRPAIEKLIPVYKKAAQLESFAEWPLLAGIHYMEGSLRRTNPTTNTNFRGAFQMSADSLRRSNINPDASPFIPGETLSDDQLVTQARAAIKVFLRPKGRYLGVDVSKPLSLDDTAKITMAYKSGEGSTWFRGTSDPNLHAYAWAGYDAHAWEDYGGRKIHALPMTWGPGSPYGDEEPTDVINRPGALMIWASLKSGNIAGPKTTSCQQGTLQPISGDRKELVQRILNNEALVLGNYGNERTQKTDIENLLTINLLKLMVAILEQSGSKLLVNSLVTDHAIPGVRDTGDHPIGKAIDIGYYGNGTSEHNEDGDQLYKYLYNNRDALNIRQMIWKWPPQGMKCLGGGEPVDCQAYYKGDLAVHDSHIHVGVK